MVLLLVTTNGYNYTKTKFVGNIPSGATGSGGVVVTIDILTVMILIRSQKWKILSQDDK